MQHRAKLASNWKRRFPTNDADATQNIEAVSPAKRLKSSNGDNQPSSYEANQASLNKNNEANSGDANQASDVVMTSDQIKAMMSNTMKEIQARKQALSVLKSDTVSEKTQLPPP